MKIPHVTHRPWTPSAEPLWRAPRAWPWFPALVRLVGPVYVRFGLGLDCVDLKGIEHLASALNSAREIKTRSVMVFRHCGDADPQGLWYALNLLARRPLRRLGLRLPHFVFLASAEIALWGGGLANLALRASGTLPLAHGRGSRPSLDYLRQHFKTSTDPVVLAPEGQITYERSGPIQLDPGAANMALWAAEAGPACLVPVGVRYRVPRETWARWSRFVDDLERGIGVEAWEGARDETGAQARLARLWDHLLARGEDYYRRHHRVSLPPLEDRTERVRRLTRTAVDLAARFRGLASGEVRPTVFQLRAEALPLVFPRQRDPSLLGRQLEERVAAEAWWIQRHQELGDLLQCLHPEALPERPDLEQAVEAALNLADFAGRLAGGHVGHRPRFFRRRLEITVGSPWHVVREPAVSHRAAAAAITAQIREALEELSLR